MSVIAFLEYSVGIIYPVYLQTYCMKEKHIAQAALTLALVLPQKRPAEGTALYPLVHVCFQPNGRLQCRQFQVSLPEKE